MPTFIRISKTKKDMCEAFFVDDFEPVNYTTEHLAVVIISLIFGIYFVYSGTKRWGSVKKKKYAIILAGLMAISQLSKTFIRLALGNYDQTTDLPLHLCSLMPFVFMFAYWKESREIWAIFFFWLMAGTFQAMFTPTLTDFLPHYEAIRYWLVHAGGVILAVYGFFAYGWRLQYKDVIKSAFAMNLAALVIYPINIWLGSNYFFLNGKPEGTTLYSLLPEWPTYILCLEGVVFLLFSLVYFIFMGPSIIKKSTSNI